MRIERFGPSGWRAYLRLGRVLVMVQRGERRA